MIYKVNGSDGSVMYWEFTEYDDKNWVWDAFDENNQFMETATMSKERATEIIKEALENFNFKGTLVQDYYLEEQNYN